MLLRDRLLSLSGGSALTSLGQGSEEELELLVLNVHLCLHFGRAQFNFIVQGVETIERESILNLCRNLSLRHHSSILNYFVDSHVHLLLRGWLLEADGG